MNIGSAKMSVFFKAVFFTILISLTGMSLSACNSQEQVTTLRLHQFLPRHSVVPKHILDVWIKNVETASNGRLKIEHYPSMQLGGKPPELYDQAVDGVADIIWTVPGYTSGRFPETELFELPFMMSNAEATSRALWTLAQDTLINDEMKDVKVLALWVHGPGLIHSKEPVRSLDDLKGLKLRAPSRPISMLLTNLGAEPIGMPVPAVPENLSKDVISATVLPWEVTGALKVPELVSNHTEFSGHSLYTLSFVFAMNRQSYDKLPDDLKKIIDDNSGLEFSAFAGKTHASYDAPQRAKAKERGNTIITLSQEEAVIWKQASQSTIDQWIAEMSAKGLDGKALVERARALTAEHSQ